MRKRLPLPLILLTPIVLLVVVVVAGIYRFSMSDEEILQKFPSQPVQANVIVHELFDLTTPNPWTIQVPETQAFAFIEHYDEVNQRASGKYDDGQVRGEVHVDTRFLTPIDHHAFAGILFVSNQGSGVFYYLATFKFDAQRQRLILADAQFIGDRISVSALSVKDRQIELVRQQRDEDQAMAEAPSQSEAILFSFNQRFLLTKQ